MRLRGVMVGWWGAGVWAIGACAGEDRLLVLGWLLLEREGAGDSRAWVGLRCKVKVPRRGSNAAAKGRKEGGRERALGWMEASQVYLSFISILLHGRPPGQKVEPFGLRPH